MHAGQWPLRLGIVVVGGLLLCCLLPYLALDPLVNLLNGTPPPVVPEYPHRQQIQRRVERRGARVDRVTTFQTADPPEMVLDFYARNLGPPDGRWSPVPFIAPFRTWTYDTDYCPHTAVGITYSVERSALGEHVSTAVEQRVSRAACRDGILTVTVYIVRGWFFFIR